MTRCLVVAIVLAGCQAGVSATPSDAPAMTPPPRASAPPAIDPAASAGLHALGEHTLAQLAHDAPIEDVDAQRARHEIPAIGACRRPTEAERAVIIRALRAYDRDTDPPDDLSFGCVEPAGTIVDIAYEHETGAHSAPRGHWRTLRVGATGVTMLHGISGSTGAWQSEGSDEVELHPLVLVDLDGDGTLDAILASNYHEGGSSSDTVTLSTWLSSTRRLRDQLGTYSDYVTVARGQLHGARQPVVVQIDSHHAPPDGDIVRRYRCIEPDGTLDRCAAITEARRVDRAVEVASWFVASDHAYGATALPDREMLAGLLDEIGAPATPGLIARMPPTPTPLHVAAEIARLLAARVSTRFGELPDTPTPDPRIAALAQLLGDAPCAPATASARADAIRAADAWAATHDAAALVADGDCVAGARCKYAHHGTPAVLSSCALGTRGYFTLRWTYVDADRFTLVARDAVFYLDVRGAQPIVTATSKGDAMTCNECDGPPAPAFEPRFLRHGTTIVALIMPSGSALTVAADGVVTTVPVVEGTTMAWYPFGASLDTTTPPDDVVEISTDHDDALWHWDGTWRPVATLLAVGPDATAALTMPSNPVEAWLWHMLAQAHALAALQEFSPDDWATSADTRAATLDELAMIGADPDVIARIAAAGSAMPP